MESMGVRKTWRKDANGKWEPLEFEELKPGDEFRLEDSKQGFLYGTVATPPQPCSPAGNWAFKVSTFSWLDY